MLTILLQWTLIVNLYSILVFSSWHIMITGCVWWTIVSNVYTEFSKTQWHESLVKGLWPLIAIFIMMVLISRVLIVCHLIHQVLLGLMVAVILNLSFEHYNDWLEEASLKSMCIMLDWWHFLFISFGGFDFQWWDLIWFSNLQANSLLY